MRLPFPLPVARMLAATMLSAMAAAVIMAGPIHAQTRAAAPPPAPQQQPQAPASTSAPFDNDLARLSEILGTLHYLRALCGSNEGGRWRAEMQALIDAETPSGERRARMVASFNRGYHGFQQSYRSCTPAATTAITRYLNEGARISRDLTARYAN